MLQNISGCVSSELALIFFFFYCFDDTRLIECATQLGAQKAQKDKNVKKVTTKHIYFMTFTVHSLNPNPDSPKSLVPYPGF
jgi:hypothetical protein